MMTDRRTKRGAALIVVMWVLAVLAIMVSTFAFEMQLEARIITARRMRFKADQLALAGIELAKAMLSFEDESAGPEPVLYDDPWMNAAAMVTRGVPAGHIEEFGEGTVTVLIDYEESRRNIRKMTDDDWIMLFEWAGIPNTRWSAMIDCLRDWEDEDDLTRLNGAESDDPFYRERGYEVKNAPIDMVDELLLIKNWGPEVLFGTPEDDPADTPIRGIGRHLTTWGQGRVNPNSASADVLYSMPIPEQLVQEILELRLGIDGVAGTPFDGITQAEFAALGLSTDLFTLIPEYATITSIGQVGDIESVITCIFRLGGEQPVPLFWLEGKILDDTL